MEKKIKGGQLVLDFSSAFDSEQLRAVTMYMEQKGISLESELLDYVSTLYKRHVPKQVRDFLDSTQEKPRPAEKTDEGGALPEENNE